MYNVPTILFVLLCLMPDNFISRVVDLLQNGAILNKIFQPYESHIPYLLQVTQCSSYFTLSNEDDRTISMANLLCL